MSTVEWCVVEGELVRSETFESGYVSVSTLRWCSSCGRPVMVFPDGMSSHRGCKVVGVPVPVVGEREAWEALPARVREALTPVDGRYERGEARRVLADFVARMTEPPEWVPSGEQVQAFRMDAGLKPARTFEAMEITRREMQGLRRAGWLRDEAVTA